MAAENYIESKNYIETETETETETEIFYELSQKEQKKILFYLILIDYFL